MSSNCPVSEPKQPGMDAAVVGDSSFPQVSNLLRRFANSQPQVPSKLGLSPLSLRERLLTQQELGGSNLTSAESRSSSDMSIPFDPELQSLWELGNQHAAPPQPQYEGSPLNPNLGSDNHSLRQMHLRQQLGAMAAALLPRSGSIPPSDSVGSGDSRPNQKRRWADCLAEANSLPTSSPNSPPRPSSNPAGDSHNPLMLEGTNGAQDEQAQQAGAGGAGPDAKRKEIIPAENNSEWEPRVRRKRAKGPAASANTDDEAAGSDGDGVVRIKAKSMTERQRRDRISDALRRLRGAVNSHGDMATMLNEAVDLIQQQKRRIEELEMQILQQRLRQQLAGGCRTLF